jgi:lipopolysaccharide export system protein LptA
MPTKLTDADRLKIAMALLNEVAFYDSTSVVHGALRIQAREVFIEYKASRPEVVAEARAAIARLESEPTESVSALINATVQMNDAMDVARGLDCDGTNGTDAREGKMLR